MTWHHVLIHAYATYLHSAMKFFEIPRIRTLIPTTKLCGYLGKFIFYLQNIIYTIFWIFYTILHLEIFHKNSHDLRTISRCDISHPRLHLQNISKVSKMSRCSCWKTTTCRPRSLASHRLATRWLFNRFISRMGHSLRSVGIHCLASSRRRRRVPKRSSVNEWRMH